MIGLANKKTVTIQPGKDHSVLLATTKTKKQNKPSSLLNKSLMKKEFSRMAKAVSNQVLRFYLVLLVFMFIHLCFLLLCYCRLFSSMLYI